MARFDSDPRSVGSFGHDQHLADLRDHDIWVETNH